MQGALRATVLLIFERIGGFALKPRRLNYVLAVAVTKTLQNKLQFLPA
jgi:hypothetical protein